MVCHKEFDEADKMPINGTEEEVAMLRKRMEEERGKVKEKKDKKVGNGLRWRLDTHEVWDRDTTMDSMRWVSERVADFFSLTHVWVICLG